MGTDAAERRRLSPRERRAVGVIAIAVVVLAVASIGYLHPSFALRPNSPALAVGAIKSSSLLLDGDFLVSYDFVSPSVGWALEVAQGPVRGGIGQGEFWVFRTGDGAKHWQRQITGLSLSGSLGFISPSMHFFDEGHGWINVGDPPQLYRTADGGANWLAVGVPGSQYAEITFSDPEHGWLLDVLAAKGSSGTTSSHLYSTGDGGDTWTALPDPPSGQRLLLFRRPGEGWMGTSNTSTPQVYSTIDGGRTWQTRDLPSLSPNLGTGGKGGLPAQFFTSIKLLPGAGVAAFVLGDSRSEYELTSFDGGTTWRFVGQPPSELTYSDLQYQDAFHWWGMKSGDLFRSSDAGQTWVHVALQLDEWEYHFHPIDSMHAWAELNATFVQRSVTPPVVGLAMTADGGVHWTRVNVPQPG